MRLVRLAPLLLPLLFAAAPGCAHKPLPRPELAPRIRTPGAQKPAEGAEGEAPARTQPAPAVETKE